MSKKVHHNEQCIYCQRINAKLSEVPKKHEDNKWQALQAQHEAHCEWIKTRAFQNNSPQARLNRGQP